MDELAKSYAAQKFWLMLARSSGVWPTKGSWSYDRRHGQIRMDGRAAVVSATLHKPLGLLAELTHRCPLGCPYCSNPLALDGREDELDTATWLRVFREAAALGVLQVHLSGGEPGARRDLVDITAGAHAAGLYTNLITSAVGITDKTLGALGQAGLDHVQISIQDADAQSADHIAGYAGAFARKRALATEVLQHKLPLTVNAVVHRANIDRIADMVDLALALGAGRIEIAHVQYYGWALENRAALMPTREQVETGNGGGGGVAHPSTWPHRHRCGGSGLLCPLPEAVRRRLGSAFTERDAGGQGAALSCRRVDTRPCILERARAFARRHLGKLPGLQCFSRHRMDEGAMRKLPASRAGFRRLPLPGLRAHR
jgi:pyruvate-formate lyase-activating enzyme